MRMVDSNSGLRWRTVTCLGLIVTVATRAPTGVSARAEAKRNQDCDRDEPAKFHGVDLLDGRTAGYLRNMYCLRTACTYATTSGLR